MSRRGFGEWVAGVVGDAIVVEKAAVVGKKNDLFRMALITVPTFKILQTSSAATYYVRND